MESALTVLLITLVHRCWIVLSEDRVVQVECAVRTIPVWKAAAITILCVATAVFGISQRCHRQALSVAGSGVAARYSWCVWSEHECILNLSVSRSMSNLRWIV